MTNATATPQTQKPRLMQAVQANEWGQITDLEPHQTYLVMRRPTRDVMTKERANAILEDVKAFLQDQRLVTEKQVQQFQEKYADPAKARAKEIRQTLERRFDEIAKEVEARVEKLEVELEHRAPQVSQALKGRKGEKATEAGASSASTAETPGEMPTGEGAGEGPAETGAESSSAGSSGAGDAGANASGARKKGAKKPE